MSHNHSVEKTNVMRLLDQQHIRYKAHICSADTKDISVAASIGHNPECIFKTLVTEAGNREHYVFVIPVNATLNLKKAAKAAGVKNIEMIKQKELLPLTGYIHGGCSPIGMKKQFKTFIEETASLCPVIFFSAGKVGRRVEMDPNDLVDLINAEYADLI